MPKKRAFHRAVVEHKRQPLHGWAVEIERYDGKRRQFARYAPTAEGKARAAAVVVQLRGHGIAAFLVPAASKAEA
jgi:hypothetical protein